ncbi:hypothetical protein BZA77DRAFT_108721 [Pyronema omphalodes]|nr:hypothetical protein BZA77DRAFT_108721 [Pyronema omphalodes]
MVACYLKSGPAALPLLFSAHSADKGLLFLHEFRLFVQPSSMVISLFTFYIPANSNSIILCKRAYARGKVIHLIRRGKPYGVVHRKNDLIKGGYTQCVSEPDVAAWIQPFHFSSFCLARFDNSVLQAIEMNFGHEHITTTHLFNGVRLFGNSSERGFGKEILGPFTTCMGKHREDYVFVYGSYRQQFMDHASSIP